MTLFANQIGIMYGTNLATYWHHSSCVRYWWVACSEDPEGMVRIGEKERGEGKNSSDRIEGEKKKNQRATKESRGRVIW